MPFSGRTAEGREMPLNGGTAEGRGMPLNGGTAERAGALLPPLDLRSLRLQKDIALKMLRLGIPLGLETLMYTFSCVVLTSAVNTFGTDTVAAYAGFVRIESFYWMLEQALAVSITTFVGQNLGAGLYGRVRSVSRQGAALMYIFMGTAIVIMYAGCPVWLGLFTTDPDVLKIGVEMMRYLLPFYILYVPDGVFFSTLRGMGDSLRPALITFIGVCVLRILWVLFVFPQFPTMRALLFCFPVSWSVTAVIYAVYYSWYRKNVICITGGSS
jgi:Na+-driven multidrug efflux pump